MEFEWDDAKADSNERKHGVSFTEPGWRPGVNERTTRMATSHDDPEPNDDLEPGYDFRSLRGVVRGKYAERYRERLRVVRLAADVSTAFADEAAVNSCAARIPQVEARAASGRPGPTMMDCSSSGYFSSTGPADCSTGMPQI